MTKITIGRMQIIDTTNGEACAVVTADGKVVGEIVKEVQDLGASTIDWKTVGYTVDVDWSDDRQFFNSADYPTGARGALAAAKAWVRESHAAHVAGPKTVTRHDMTPNDRRFLGGAAHALNLDPADLVALGASHATPDGLDVEGMVQTLTDWAFAARHDGRGTHAWVARELDVWTAARLGAAS